MKKTHQTRLNIFPLIVGVSALLPILAGCPPCVSPPRADAGIDQTVKEGDAVQLVGVNSADPIGGPLTFEWSQLPGGVPVSIGGVFLEEASFDAPQVAGPDINLQFELTVTNDQGCFDSDIVVITVADDPPCTNVICPDDGAFCNGTEFCDDGQCHSSGNPCPAIEFCNEDTDSCDPLCMVTSTFSSSSDGWIIRNNDESGSSDPNYVATGGNPDGHISADDNRPNITWFFQAPSKFHGDFSAALGLTLTFDLKQSSLSSQFDLRDVVLSGGGLSIHLDTRANPGTEWTSYIIRLDETADWGVGSLSGPAATESDMLTVLSDLTNLLIRGEFVSGPDTGSLDNVVLNLECN